MQEDGRHTRHACEITVPYAGMIRIRFDGLACASQPLTEHPNGSRSEINRRDHPDKWVSVIFCSGAAVTRRPRPCRERSALRLRVSGRQMAGCTAGRPSL